jgi:hypothetical protein
LPQREVTPADEQLRVMLYNVLFFFTTGTTLLSGGLGFLLKLPAFYKPGAYLICPRGALVPGRGDTPFEELSTFVFGVMYVGPLVGMAYAHMEGSAAAKRAACLMPLIYHAASVLGVLRVFPAALNPAVAPLPAAAAMHAVYAGLFAALLFAAADAKGKAA